MSVATEVRPEVDVGTPARRSRRFRGAWLLLLAPIAAFDAVLFLTPLGKLVASSMHNEAY
jgi:hypothetical protein